MIKTLLNVALGFVIGYIGIIVIASVTGFLYGFLTTAF